MLIDVAPKQSFNSSLLKALRISKPYGVGSNRRMSRGQLANKLGITPRHVVRLEGGKVIRVNLKMLKQICLYFQVDPKTLLGLEYVDKDKVEELVGVDIEMKVCPICHNAELVTIKRSRSNGHGSRRNAKRAAK